MIIDYQSQVNLCRCAAARAHIYGAEAVILEKKADALAAGSGDPPRSIEEASATQLLALELARQAHEARRRYFRELATADLLAGHSTPFDALG